jgi:hypothetical protein
VPEIAVELGVAKSTAFQWTRQIALVPDLERSRQRRERSKRMTEAYWATHRKARAAERDAVRETGAEWVGRLTERELLLVGAVAYWCEGAKTKPWGSEYRLIFTNSDPVLVELFVAFVEELGVPRASLKYRLSIHESADVARATRWWAEQIGVSPDGFQRPTLKRHNPTTKRHNVGDDYRGCLVITVPRGRVHYWRIEGIMEGLARCRAWGEVG